MEEPEISKDQIDALVKQLPSYYIKELARVCFGRATQKNKRSIKHWRSGQMKDQVKSKLIFAKAHKLREKYAAVAAA